MSVVEKFKEEFTNFQLFISFHSAVETNKQKMRDNKQLRLFLFLYDNVSYRVFYCPF